MHPRAWNKYEIALLIEAYLRVKNDNMALEPILLQLSKDLRAMEMNNSTCIDDTFRNVNGMHWQYGFIKIAFEKETFENRKPPKAFLEMVSLYQEDHDQFLSILNEAHAHIINLSGEKNQVQSQKQKFIDYYDGLGYQKFSSSKCIGCLERVSEYAQKHSICRNDFWEINDSREFNAIRSRLSADRIFKFSCPSDFRLFEKVGKYYSDFLKQTKEQAQTEKQLFVATSFDAQSNETVEEQREASNSNISDGIVSEFLMHLDESNDLSYTKPIFYTIYSESKMLVASWTDLYVQLVKRFYHDKGYCFKIGQSFNRGSRIDIGPKDNMVSPKQIDNDVYLETNVSASGIVGKLLAVCDFCAVNPELIQIGYNKKERSTYSDLCSNKIMADFSKWMIHTNGLGAITTQSYISSLKKANRYALENGYTSTSIFDLEDSKLKSEISRLLSNPEFSSYNAEQHNRFSAALNAFVKFKESTDCVESKRFSLDCEMELREILETNFKYGYRDGSIIDRTKLNGFAEKSGLVLPNDSILNKWLIEEGVFSNGKYYFISKQLSDSVYNLFDKAFSSGAQVVYFDTLFEIYFDELNENGIASSELLKGIFEKTNKVYTVRRNYATSILKDMGELPVFEKEFSRVWGDNIVLNYEKLYERLPYVPQEKIRFYLSRSESFVWNANEEFACIDKICIDDASKQEIMSFVQKQCAKNGFVSINDLPTERIAAEYFELSPFAIQQAVYFLLLKDSFSINGKLISCEGNSADLETMAQNYCASKNECTFDEINEYVSSISGESNRQLSFKAAYEQLVRIDKDHFVSENQVIFDIDEIDKAISKFFVRDYLPLQDVISFVMFPYCGHAWNRFLLESFCFRFSKKFSLLLKSFNNKNAGVIIKKESNLNYNEVLIDAIAHSGMKFDVEIIGDYLYNNGYIAKKRLGNMPELIAQAQEIKEDK